MAGRSLMAKARAGKLSPNTGIDRACSRSFWKPLVEMFARLLACAFCASAFWLAPVIAT
ncbi:hypothetical protein D3C84_880570 [compost metagenome]